MRERERISSIFKIEIESGSARLYNSKDKEISTCLFVIDKKNKQMYISEFDTDHNYQHKGYGHFLVSIVIALARKYRLKLIYLTDGTLDGHFWPSCGFNPPTGIGKGRNKLYSVIYLC